MINSIVVISIVMGSISSSINHLKNPRASFAFMIVHFDIRRKLVIILCYTLVFSIAQNRFLFTGFEAKLEKILFDSSCSFSNAYVFNKLLSFRF